MPEGYSGQYSLRRNLVSLSNRELLQKMFAYVLKTKQKAPNTQYAERKPSHTIWGWNSHKTIDLAVLCYL